MNLSPALPTREGDSPLLWRGAGGEVKMPLGIADVSTALPMTGGRLNMTGRGTLKTAL